MRIATLALVAACGSSAPPPAAPQHTAPAAQASPQSTGDDGADDIPVTELHAKRWPYARFFNQMKRAVRATWHPETVWRSLAPAAQAPSGSLNTKVHVVLTPLGALQSVTVTAPSGNPALDAEAVRAFQAASPFANPPAGLLKNGVVELDFAFDFDPASSAAIMAPTAQP
jgi:TonB family protein